MATKTSKVSKCTLSSEWKSPGGFTVYYHLLHLENGDTGNCGRKEKYPEDLNVGTEIEYELNDNKIKFIKKIDRYNTYSGKKKTATTYDKKPDDFLGYAYAYAKDMVIAGKTTKKDLESLKDIAETIYIHISFLLENDYKNNREQHISESSNKEQQTSNRTLTDELADENLPF
jgi:hypothetical protein